MFFLKKIKFFVASAFASALLLWSCLAGAEGIGPIRAAGIRLPDGRVALSTRFHTELSQPLYDALRQGLTLQFDWDWQLTSPTFAAYKLRFHDLFSDNKIVYKLSYHPLTDHYRVSVGTLRTEYSSLENALRAVGATSRHSVLPPGLLRNYDSGDLRLSVRLSFSTENLPALFQINTIGSKDWHLDSGWIPVDITE